MIFEALSNPSHSMILLGLAAEAFQKTHWAPAQRIEQPQVTIKPKPAWEQ